MKAPILSCLLVFGLLTSARAATVSVSFSADAELVGPHFADYFDGTTMTGTFTYVTASAGGSHLKVYTGLVTEFAVEITGGEIDPLAYEAPAGTLTVADNPPPLTDTFALSSGAVDGLSGSSLPIGDMSRMELRLQDTTGTAFSTADTPLSLGLGLFDTATVELSNSRGNAIYRLTWLHGAVVPVPAAVWLLGSGAFGLLFYRHRARIS